MKEMSDYRQAVRTYRRSMNFARKNYALPLIPMLMAAWPSILSGIKIAGTLIMAFTMCKELFTTILGRVPHFFKRLWEYRDKSAKVSAQQEKVEKARQKLLVRQKALIRIITDICIEFGEMLKDNANLGKAIQGSKYTSMAKMADYLKSDRFQDILSGKAVLTTEDNANMAKMMDGFIKEYGADKLSEESRGLLGTILVDFLPAAGYLAGGPQAVDALRASALTSRAAALPGTATATGLGMAATGLSSATKLANAFFSMPMFCFMIGSSVVDGIANNALNNKVQNLCEVAVAGIKQVEGMEHESAKLDASLAQLTDLLQQDIGKVKTIVTQPGIVDADRQKKIFNMLLKFEDILKEEQAKIQEADSKNFSALTEAAAIVAKTGVNLLKDKTFDTAMLGMIAGIAIEKYRNKKEERLANELLSKEAAKMQKFKFMA